MTRPWLRWLYGAQGVSLALLLPYLVPLLDDRGLGAAGIGLVLGASGLVSLLAYPVWGAAADGWLGRRATLALTGATAAVGGVWVLGAGDDPVMLTLALSTALMGALPWGPLSDALTLETLADEASGYGRLRAWASLGWAGAAIAAGLVWMQVGPGLVLVAFAVSALAVSGLALLPSLAGWPTQRGRGARAGSAAPEVAGSAAPEVAGSAAPEVAGSVRGLRVWLPLLASPILLGFMLGLLVASVGEHASWRYISLRILEQGGGVILVGLAAALPAIIEIPVFTSSRRLAGRLGLRMVYVWGAFVAAGLTLLVAFAPEAWMVTLLRTVEGTSYALRYMGMVLIIGVLLPRHLHAVGQSLAWFISAGVAPIIADAGGGLIYDQLGAAALFIVSSFLLVAGAAIVYAVLSGPRFRRAVITTEAHSDGTPIMPRPD